MMKARLALKRALSLSIAFVVLLISVAADSRSETTSQSDTFAKANKESKASAKADEALSSEGLELAKKHLQELVPVLEHLKLNSLGQYEKAIRDLDRASKRLESIKRRDHKLYEIALQEWKTRCQIDLLKAKLHVQKSAPDQERVIQRLKALREIEIKRINRELALLESRAQMLNERVSQSRQMLEKGELRRQQLLKDKQSLMNKTIDWSVVSSKASEPNKKNSTRADEPTGSSSKKDKK